jgi:hypothetical protein
MILDGIAATIAIISSDIEGSLAILASFDRAIIAPIESGLSLYKQLGNASS